MAILWAPGGGGGDEGEEDERDGQSFEACMSMEDDTHLQVMVRGDANSEDICEGDGEEGSQLLFDLVAGLVISDLSGRFARIDETENGSLEDGIAVGDGIRNLLRKPVNQLELSGTPRAGET